MNYLQLIYIGITVRSQLEADIGEDFCGESEVPGPGLIVCEDAAFRPQLLADIYVSRSNINLLERE